VVYSNILLGLPERQENFSMQTPLNLYREEQTDSLAPDEIKAAHPNKPVYIHIDNRDKERFSFEFDDDTFFEEWHETLIDSQYFNHIYSNTDTNLYFTDN
jgi:hypothetical protein